MALNEIRPESAGADDRQLAPDRTGGRQVPRRILSARASTTRTRKVRCSWRWLRSHWASEFGAQQVQPIEEVLQ
jgi:hypothetical protein